MTYQLKGGEEWRDGKLYGWTGRDCDECRGTGENDAIDYHDGYRLACSACSGTGEEWDLMPVQPSETENKEGNDS